MENQNPPPQTQNGDMETTQSPTAQEPRPTLQPLSSLLADDSIDHTGAPIPLEYTKLWVTKASANREKLGSLSMEDLDAIHFDIAPAAVQWERENDMTYSYDQSPIDHEHPGLRDAKIVPVRLNLGEGASTDSFAGDKALRNNDFTALLPTGLPHEETPQNLRRWRTYDSHLRLRKIFPAHNLIWQDPDSGALWARIPKPLEGMSRAGCDHCRLHDHESAGEYVDYFDDRPHVDGIRAMSAGDTAATPFSLCRFHWWYVWSGELLRPSQVHVLEVLVGGDFQVLVGGDLRERWGISHMREFLLSMECQSPTPEEVDCDNQRRRGHPDQEHALEGLVNGIQDMVLQRAEESGLPKAKGATVASTDAQLTVVCGQQASATTADEVNDTFGPAESPRTSGQSMLTPHNASEAWTGSKGQSGSQANGRIPSSTVERVSHPQTNGMPAPRHDKFLRSPPRAPQFVRKRFTTGRVLNKARRLDRPRRFVLTIQLDP